MKFTVSTERKCQAAKPYESFTMFIALEGDTANISPEALFEQAKYLLDEQVVTRKVQLANEYQQELDNKKGRIAPVG